MRWSRMTSMAALLLHGVGQEAEVAGALDGLGEGALLLGRDGGDAARHHLAALGDVALQQLHVLVVDLGRVQPAERAGLAAPEEGPPAGAAAAGTLAAALAAAVVGVGHHASPSEGGADSAPPWAAASPRGGRSPWSRRGRSSR